MTDAARDAQAHHAHADQTANSARATKAKRRMLRRRRLVTFTAILVLVLGVGGYASAVALAPLPELQATLATDANQQIDADTAAVEAVIDAQSLPTAIGWADGEEVWSNDDTKYSLASISKLITVLVCMDAEPLEQGADGPTYVWTAADRQRTNEYLALHGVAYPIPVGTEVTLRQMLKLIFLPSANDFAEAYAYRVFGDNDTFIKAVDAWKQKHGLESLQFVEPTGMDERNQASAADLVRIARLVVQNPTILEFNGMKTAEMPWGIGTIENTNPLLGEVPGVIGLKTGTLYRTGYNLVLAQEAEANGREIVNLSVTLARQSHDERAASGREMLDAMATLPEQVNVVDEGSVFGSVITWQGEKVDLVATAAASSTLLPGESVERSAELGTVTAGASGREVGVIRIAAPTETEPVPIVTTAPIVEPDFWWRFTHPSELFG